MKIKKGILLSIVVLAMILVTGCSKEKPLKTATASTSVSNNGIELKMDIEFTYSEDSVRIQKQKSLFKGASIDELEKFIKDNSFADFQSIADNSKGIEYKIEKNEAEKSVAEIISIDFTKITKTEYTAFTGQTLPDEEKVYISLDKTLETLEQQGFTVKR